MSTHSPEPPPETGFSTAKTVIIIAIVVGCFAVLYPKIFYPMLFDTSYNAKPKTDAHEVPHRPPDRPGFGPHPGMRGGGDQGKPMFMGEEGKHLRRTLEKDLRPGPVPGMRPTMGGPGIQPQQSTKGQGGAMGILMPIYSIGIVIFFCYTIMKLVFKNKDDEGNTETARSKQLHHQKQQQQLYQQQLRARQLQQEQQQQQILAAQQYQLQQQRAAAAAARVEQLPVIPEQVVRQADILPTAEESITALDQHRVEVMEPIPMPAPSNVSSTNSSRDVEEKRQIVEQQMDARDEEIIALKKKLADAEAMMQQFMTQVTSTMQAAQEIRQSRSEDECFIDQEDGVGGVNQQQEKNEVDQIEQEIFCDQTDHDSANERFNHESISTEVNIPKADNVRSPQEDDSAIVEIKAEDLPRLDIKSQSKSNQLEELIHSLTKNDDQSEESQMVVENGDEKLNDQSCLETTTMAREQEGHDHAEAHCETLTGQSLATEVSMGQDHTENDEEGGLNEVVEAIEVIQSNDIKGSPVLRNRRRRKPRRD